MDINTLQNILIGTISANTPLLTDYSQGSVNYTLTRGIACGLLDLYNKVELLEKQFIIPNADQGNLDILGNSLNIRRINGIVASGYVYATNQESRVITIPRGLVLTNPISLQQYKIAESDNINLPAFSDLRLRVESIEATTLANVKAGTQLINPQYPFINFMVGSYKSINGDLQGDISNALSLESDIEYRERILRTLFSNTNNYTLVRNELINQGDIINVLFNNTEPGKVEVWVQPKTSISNIRLQQLNVLLENSITLGIVPEVKVLNIKPITFKIMLFDKEIDSNNLNQIREYIKVYLAGLKYLQPLVISDLTTYLVNKINKQIQILLPLDVVTTIQSGEIFTLDRLEVVYNV